ncbi:ribosome maturation factor RimP [Lachnospiraceae bacterium ZAX-1]
MTRREQYEQQTQQLLQNMIEEHNFELIDVEYVKEGGNWYLRVYIDKEGGITVDDCEMVSRYMNTVLDEKDFIEDSYIFEVSSPGLGRPLKKEKDYIRSIGKEVEIRTYRAIRVGSESKEKEFYGILKAYDADTVTIERNTSIEADEKQEIIVAKSDIALIRLAFDF